MSRLFCWEWLVQECPISRAMFSQAKQGDFFFRWTSLSIVQPVFVQNLLQYVAQNFEDKNHVLIPQ